MSGQCATGWRIRSRTLLTCGAMALAMLAWTGSARAQAKDGISVQGNGEAKGRPSQLEISCSISAEAELASDATVKFRDAKKHALATIDALKNPNLTIVSNGVSVNSNIDANTQMMIMRGQATNTVKPKVQLLETYKLTIKDIDKLEPEALLEMVLNIVDTAKDAGFQIGPPPVTNYNELQMRQQQGNAMVSFEIADSTALRDQALKAAFDDAKAKAQKLADLAGVKLGHVVAVHEGGKTDGNNPAYDAQFGATPDKTLSGSTFGEMTLNASVSVQFEIAK